MAAIDCACFEAAETTVIWRYMSAARLRDLLGGGLFFAAASQFDDQFEGAVTQAEQVVRRQTATRMFPDDEPAQAEMLSGLSDAFEDLRRMTKISCWHARPEENIAMWERYRPTSGEALAIRSTVGALKQSLRDFRLKPHYGSETIRVGAVRYIDYATDTMSDGSMLGIFLHKRLEYSDEHEIRALLSLRMAAEFGVQIPDGGVSVPIDPQIMIDEIRTSPYAKAGETKQVANALDAAKVTCPVARSTLAVEPVY
jgi:hypothetical protein